MLRRLWRRARGNNAASEREDRDRDEESALPLTEQVVRAIPEEISVDGSSAQTGPHKRQAVRKSKSLDSFSVKAVTAIFLECGIVVNDLPDRQIALTHPLHWAVRKWKNPLLQSLLECLGQWRGNVESVDEKGMRPLHAAAEINNLDAFKVLQTHGADVHAFRSDRNAGDQPVHSAAFECSMAVLKYLIPESNISEDQEFVAARNLQGETPLHCAAYSKKKPTLQITCVQYLLEHGAMVNTKDKSKGDTPLHIACRKNLIDLVKVMADIRPEEFCQAMQMTNTYGKTPRDLAWKGTISMVTLEDQQKLMQLLLDRGLPCDIEGADGGSALRLAAENGDEELVERLLAGGALIYPDEVGCTAFLNATAGNYVSIMRSIYGKFGRTLTMDAKDKVGNTALHYAAANDAAEAIAFLLSLGAKVLEDSSGRTPMDLAIFHRSQRSAQAFVDDSEWRKHVMRPSRDYDSILLGLIQFLPDVVSSCLDKCMNVEKNLETPDKSYTEYDLTIFYPPEYSDTKQAAVYMAPMRALEIMASCGQDKLLAHPVCISLLERKWLRYGFFCSVVIMAANLAVVGLLTYILMSSVETDLRPYLLQKSHKNIATHNPSALNNTPIEELYRRGHNHGVAGFDDDISVLFLALSLVLILFMEGTNLFSKGLRYFKDWINYVGFLLFISCAGFLISFQLQGQGRDDRAWTYQFGAVAVFLAWFNLMRCCRPFGTFGIYSIMFFRIMKTLMEVLLFFALLIVAFAAAFCVLFQSQIFPDRYEFHQYQSSLEPNTLRTGHDTLFFSGFRIGAMTTGELDFLSTFLYPLMDGMLEYPTLAAIFYAIFLMLMPILLNNLLIGLAVGDMDAIRNNAAALRREIQVYLHYALERLFPAKLLKRFQDETISYREYAEEEKSLLHRIATWLQSGSPKQSDKAGTTNTTDEVDAEEPIIISKRNRQMRLKSLEPSLTKLERELEPDELVYHKLQQLDNAVQEQAKLLTQILDELKRRPPA
ncbi:putative Transient receptor potential cation channel subfamily A member 1 [Hypsibius exemplaris]|uniref:Transient receptor potential cation channel subfamily A member 1 n=1 Tax=Hypsibius exemplaris TaxID=2072580 RepID=A0A9X6NGX9_HYPEX|nr:putative Transient receptor potential cation channel subfamily A member 1 [Hypsibius exemplaris]